MLLSHGTWVLILDGEKYLLLQNEGDRSALSLRVLQHAEIDNPPTRDQGTEKPGRMPAAGAGRSAVEQTDWHTLEKESFAHDVADRLRRWALADRFSQIVICADPRTLGTIRHNYHAEGSRRIVAELDKDLTGLPIDEMEKVIGAA